MSSSLTLPLVLSAAESAGHSGPSPYLISGIVLFVLLALLVGLLAFGGGREHT